MRELEKLATITNCTIKVKGDRVLVNAKEGKLSDTYDFHPRAAQAYLRGRIRSSQVANYTLRKSKLADQL